MTEKLDPMTKFGGYSIQGGQLISDRVQRIVQAINDYEPELEVQWIPDRQATEQNVAQFKIVHHQPDGHTFTLFHVKNEEEFDERILLRIIQNDQRRGKQNLSEYEAWEQTQKLVNKQLYLDQMEEATDIAAKIFASHKNTYKVNENLTVKEGIPFNANRLEGPKFYNHGK